MNSGFLINMDVKSIIGYSVSMVLAYVRYTVRDLDSRFTIVETPRKKSIYMHDVLIISQTLTRMIMHALNEIYALISLKYIRIYN